MTKKTGMLATIALAALIIFGFVGYSSYKNSEDAPVDRLATALLENDEAAIMGYMPSYSNKKKITKAARNVFQQQLKKLKKKQVYPNARFFCNRAA